MIGIDFSGKVALCCGAGRGGMGTAVALALGEAGATVVAVDHDREEAEKAAALVEATGVRCVPVTADLTDPAAPARIVAQALRDCGRLDLVANVAGGTKGHQWQQLELVDDDIYRDTFALNVDYVFRIGREAAKAMIAQGQGGAICSTASVSGMGAAPHHGAYGAAKAALIALTRTQAIEWLRHGIRVNAVAPGAVLTPRILEYGTTDSSNADGRRTVTSREVATAMMFLLSPLASGITGLTVPVDSGVSANNALGGFSHFAEIAERARG